MFAEEFVVVGGSLALMRAARMQVALVAWALFTDKLAWNELLLSEGRDGAALDKGELLAILAGEGRCVLMSNQTARIIRIIVNCIAS